MFLVSLFFLLIKSLYLYLTKLAKKYFLDIAVFFLKFSRGLKVLDLFWKFF